MSRFGEVNSSETVSLTALTGMTNFVKNSGIATLVLGTVTVSDAGVTADSIIIITPRSGGILNGNVRVSNQTVGVSFTILSSNLADTANIGWVRIEPA